MVVGAEAVVTMAGVAWEIVLVSPGSPQAVVRAALLASPL